MKLLEKTYFWTILFFIFGTVCLGYLNFGGPHHALMSLFFILATFVFFVLIARSPVISRDFRLKAFMRKNVETFASYEEAEEAFNVMEAQKTQKDRELQQQWFAQIKKIREEKQADELEKK